MVTNRGSPFSRRRNGFRGMVTVPVPPVGVGSGGFGLLLAAIGVGAAFGPLLLRGLVDLVLASSLSLGRATWSYPAASWTDRTSAWPAARRPPR